MPVNAGNSFSTAGDLNPSPAIQTFTDSVNPSNLNDYYRFNLNSAGYINLSLKGASANVDLQLIQDLNNNGRAETREIIGRSALGGTATDAISVALAPGTYYVQVYANSRITTNYNLNWSATSLGSANYTDPASVKSYFGTEVTRSFFNSSGISTYQSQVGNFLMSGAIADYYTNNNFKNPNSNNGLLGVYSGLGLPTSPISKRTDGSLVMEFQGGTLTEKNGTVTPTYSSPGNDRFNLVGQGAPLWTELQWKNDYSWFGADSVGQPTGTVRRVAQGWIQEFTGSRKGDGDSVFLLKDRQAVLGGVETYTDNFGKQIERPKGGPYRVQGDILNAYRLTGGYDRVNGGLGFPTFSAERSNFNGYKTYQAFENGFIGLTTAGRTVIQNWQGQAIAAVGYDGGTIHSTYGDTFKRNGGNTSLGYASNTVHPWGDGYTQDFSGGSGGTGAILKSNANDKSYWVGGEFWNTFLNANGANGLLKYPTTDRYSVAGGWRQDFQGGAIFNTTAGTFAVYGGIGGKYLSLGAQNSFLGMPTSGEFQTDEGWTRQTFEGGYIQWKAGQATTVYDLKAIGSLPADSGHGSTSPWSVQFWNNQVMSGAPIWTGTQQAGELRFAAGLGAPVGTTGIQEDHFSGRWTTTSYFEGGIYDFISQADDGVRVYVDGQRVIDRWLDQAFVENRKEFFVPQGYHTVQVEYFENSWAAANTLRWERLNPVNEWAGEFFNNQNLQGTSVGNRGGGTGFLDKDWGRGHEFGMPIADDHFSDRWTTTRFFGAGTYDFISESDDGVRVWVDDQLLINKWQDQALANNRFFVSLDEGYHKLRVEHYDNGGEAATKLRWDQVGVFTALPVLGDRPAPTPLEYWVGEYFNNRDLNGAPVLTKLEKNWSYKGLDFNWGTGSPDSRVQSDNFSARWTTQAALPNGTYTFSVGGDDGVRLLIDGVNVLDQWKAQAFTTTTATVTLGGGMHEIQLEYFEQRGEAAVKLNWIPVINNWASPVLQNYSPGTPKTGAADPAFQTAYTQLVNTLGANVVGVPVTALREQSGKVQEFWGIDGKLALFQPPETGFTTEPTSLSFNTGTAGKSRVISGGVDPAFTWNYTGNFNDSRYQAYTYKENGTWLMPNGNLWFNRGYGADVPANTPDFNGVAYFYKTFDIPTGATNVKLDLSNISADDRVMILLNGKPLGGFSPWIDPAAGAKAGTMTDASGKVTPYQFTAGSGSHLYVDPSLFNIGGTNVLTVWFNNTGSRDPSAPVKPVAGNTQGDGAVFSLTGSLTYDARKALPSSAPVTYAFGEILAAYQQAGGPQALGYPIASQRDLGNGAYELELGNGRFFWAPGITNPTFYENFNGSLTAPADTWRGEYFNNRDWSGDPVLVRTSGSINQDWGFGSPFGTIPTDNFSVRWTSEKPFDRGTYRFVGTHDDGFQVTVNGQTPIDKLIDTSTRTTGYGTFTQSGQYRVQVNYFEHGGGAKADLTHEKASNYVVGLESNNSVNQSVIDSFWWQGGYDKMGLPSNDVHRWGNGWVQDFDGGTNGWGIVMKQDGAQYARYTTGGIWQYLREHSGVNQWGYPTDEIQHLPNGVAYQRFEKGLLVSGTNVFGIRGAALAAFDNNGGFDKLGIPINDAHRWNGGTVQDFGGGAVGSAILMQKDGTNKAYLVSGDIWNVYKAQNGMNKLGYPIDEVQHYNGADYQIFERGSIVKSQYGTYSISGAIRDYYRGKDGLQGVLGAPTSAEQGSANNRRQNFANGYIIWDGSSAKGYRKDGSPLDFVPNLGGSSGATLAEVNTFLSWAEGQKGIIRLDTTDYAGQCVSLVARYIEDVFLPPDKREVRETYGDGKNTASVVASKFSQYFGSFTKEGLPERGAIISFPGPTKDGHTGIVLESRYYQGKRQVKILESNGDGKVKNSIVRESKWINIDGSNGHGGTNGWTNPKLSPSSGDDRIPSEENLQEPGAVNGGSNPLKISGSVSQYGKSHTVELYQYNGKAIESDKETVILIHGWASDSKDGELIHLKKTIESKYGDNVQVLALDWGSIAQAGYDSLPSGYSWPAPYNTAQWVHSVAVLARDALIKLGLKPKQISIFGHSLGAFVGAEIGRIFSSNETVNSDRGTLKEFVALDPAGGYPLVRPYDIDGHGRHVPEFQQVAQKTLAFVASDRGNDHAAGDNDMAATAQKSFIVQFDGHSDINLLNPIDRIRDYHKGVVDVVANMISSEMISQVTTSSLLNNMYTNQGIPSVIYGQSIPLDKGHEGVIHARHTNNSEQPWQAYDFDAYFMA